jgi:hypothetical protein
LAEIYGPVSIVPPTKPTQENEQEPLPQTHLDQEQEQEQEFEFRLFSTHNPTAPTTHKILLKGPEEDEAGEGAFILPRRDRKFYIAEKAQGPDFLHYQASAVSGEDVLKAGKKRAWGLEVPWRVTVLQSTSPPASKSKSNPTSASNSESKLKEGEEVEKKTRPNKKRRIILRERKKKKDSAEEARRKEREAKEEAEREKKTRRNREKKVKRKLKEKAKKASGGVEEGVVENGNESASMGDG